MIKTVIDELKEYDKQYYEYGNSPISDEVYDRKKEEVKKISPNDPYFQTVGSKPSRDKVKLPHVLGSLNKIKPDSLDKWLRENPAEEGYVISQKLDGISFEVIYEEGNVVSAYTRGNGIEGRDITDKAKIFCPTIENESRIFLRAEAMLLGDIYKELEYITARNGCAGILNRDDRKYVSHVHPYFYELIEYASLKTETEYERFVLIESLGLPTPEWKLIYDLTIEDLMQMIGVSKEYYSDGVVIAINRSERENVLYPKNKVAFKVQGKVFDTVVKDIEWNVSRTGRIVPTIIVEPVNIDGVTVSRATGFNAEFIKYNYLYPGCGVSLIRSGDVIPYLVDVYDNTDGIPYLPRECPECGCKTHWKGVDLICSNENCNPRLLKSIEYFLVSLGAENVRYKILSNLMVNSLEEVYILKKSDIAGIEGFGERSAEEIVNEIQNTLNTTSEKLLQAFGIPGVGKEIAKALTACFGPLETIFGLSEDELQVCEGVGPKISENIIKSIPKCEEIYKYLKKIGLKIQNDKKEDLKMLDGKNVTLTGKGPLKRKELQMLIEKHGGNVKGISKDVNLLVTDDLESYSSKMKKAEEYGIEIITYDELMEELGE